MSSRKAESVLWTARTKPVCASGHGAEPEGRLRSLLQRAVDLVGEHAGDLRSELSVVAEVFALRDLRVLRAPEGPCERTPFSKRAMLRHCDFGRVTRRTGRETPAVMAGGRRNARESRTHR